MRAKSINAIVAEALAFYMRGRFNNSELARASGVAESSIRNFLSPSKRASGKSGKEPSGKLTELQMLADALAVPMADMVTELSEAERLERWTQRAAAYYVQHRRMPPWAPPEGNPVGKQQPLRAA